MTDHFPRPTGTPFTPAWFDHIAVNLSATERRAASLGSRRTVKKEWQAAWLLKAITCIDLTTLAGDVAAVLADEKVHFQMQEVAIVIADDRYIAADAVEAVEVEYEELPVVLDPYAALQPGAPVIRDDLAGKTSGAHGPREHHNHIFTWDAGDKAAAGDAREVGRLTEVHLFARVHDAEVRLVGNRRKSQSVRLGRGDQPADGQ